MTEERKPVHVRCKPCGHRFVSVYLPMEAVKAARTLSAARCPMCGSTGRQHFMDPGPEPDREGPDMTDAESMALCAIRYCIGRRSYIVSDGCRWAREWGATSPRVRAVITRDLEEARGRPGALGDDHDRAAWLAVLADLQKMPPA